MVDHFVGVYRRPHLQGLCLAVFEDVINCKAGNLTRPIHMCLGAPSIPISISISPSHPSFECCAASLPPALHRQSQQHRRRRLPLRPPSLASIGSERVLWLLPCFDAAGTADLEADAVPPRRADLLCTAAVHICFPIRDSSWRCQPVAAAASLCNSSSRILGAAGRLEPGEDILMLRFHRGWSCPSPPPSTSLFFPSAASSSSFQS